MDHSTRQQIRYEELFAKLDFSITPETPSSDIEALLALQNRQKEVIAHLAYVNRMGGDNVAVDKHKAEAYEEMIGASIQDDGTFTTANFYEKTGKYNHYRILGIRVNLLANFFLNKSFLPKWTPFLGLLYGPMFVFDLGVALKTTFDPRKTKDEAEFAKEHGIFALYKLRFKNVIRKDDRLGRMLNSGRWLPLNILTSAVISTAIFGFAILNSTWMTIAMAIGTGVDMLHEGIDSTIKYVRLNRSRKAVEAKKEEIATRLKAMENDSKIKTLEEELKHSEVANRPQLQQTLTQLLEERGRLNDLKEQLQQQHARYESLGIKVEDPNLTIEQLHNKHVELTHEASRIEKEVDKFKHDAVKHFLKSAIILGGLGLMLFPPTLALGAVLTAVGIAITVWDFFHSRKKQAPSPKYLKTTDAGTECNEHDIELSESKGIKNTYELTAAMEASANNRPVNDSSIPSPSAIPLRIEEEKAEVKLPDLPKVANGIVVPLPEKAIASQITLGCLSPSKRDFEESVPMDKELPRKAIKVS